MSTLMMGLIMTGCSSALAFVWRRRFEEQLPIVVTGIILVLYAFGIAGKLILGVYTVIACAFLSWIFVVYKFICSPRDAVRLMLTPGAVMLSLVFLWLLFSFRTHTVHVWDDFSHWALAVKNMVYFDALPSVVENATVSYRSYPPGSTLFEYLWTKLSGGFNEGDPQRAMNLLILSFLIPVMKNRSWGSWFRVLCTTCVIFMLPLAYNHAAYRCIYVDTLMGCIMFFGLYTWFLSEKDIHATISTGCTVVLLPLIKTSGLLMTAIVLIVIVLDLFSDKSWVDYKKKWQEGALIGATILSAMTWRVFLTLNQVSETMISNNFSFAGLFNVLIGRGKEYQIATIRNFLDRMMESNIIANDSRLRLSVVMLMCIYAVVVLVLTFLRVNDKKRKKRWISVLWNLGIGMAVYTSAVLLTYLFAFKPHEAEGLYSFGRYLCPMLIVLTGMLWIALDELQSYRFKFLPSAAMLIGIVLLADPTSISNSTFRANDQGTRLQYALQERRISDEEIQLLDEKTDKVFLIVSPEKGYDFFLNAYHITPVQTQPATWWVSETKPEKWHDVLTNGSYTHLYSLEESFTLENEVTILEPDMLQSGILYRIQHNSEGTKLIEVTE